MKCEASDDTGPLDCLISCILDVSGCVGRFTPLLLLIPAASETLWGTLVSNCEEQKVWKSFRYWFRSVVSLLTILPLLVTPALTRHPAARDWRHPNTSFRCVENVLPYSEVLQVRWKHLSNLAVNITVGVGCCAESGLLVGQISDDQTAQLLRTTPGAPCRQNHPLKSLAPPTPGRAQDVLHTRLRSKTRRQPSVQPVGLAHLLARSGWRTAARCFCFRKIVMIVSFSEQNWCNMF